MINLRIVNNLRVPTYKIINKWQHVYLNIENKDWWYNVNIVIITLIFLVSLINNNSVEIFKISYPFNQFKN